MRHLLLFPAITLCLQCTSCKDKTNNPLPITPINIDFCTAKGWFTDKALFTDAEIGIAKDVVYSRAPDREGSLVDLTMDVYFHHGLPSPPPALPALIMIHGGGYQGGDKSEWSAECIEFAKRGFSVFNINYRTGWEPEVQQDRLYAAYRASQDLRAALRFVAHHGDIYRVNADYIFVGGGSSGANMALNLTYITQGEWNVLGENLESDLGSLNNSGNNYSESYTVLGIYNNWGGVISKTVEAQELLPMISFHGEMDSTVDIDSASDGFIGSRVIHNLLIKKGICSELNVKPGGEHGIYLDPAGIEFRAERASCFFRRLMCHQCENAYFTEKIEARCEM